MRALLFLLGTISAIGLPGLEANDKLDRDHWAFSPINDPEIPDVRHLGWASNEIDHFVLRKLEQHDMQPSDPIDRARWVRRLSIDLRGLPPTREEIAAFESDDSPAAQANMADEFLASVRYGERWARHWLDVARYADTRGYVFTAERKFPFSYTFRDYVIDSFNEDLPYDRFILEQLAADQLDLGDDKKALAAMGFLTLGRRFLNNKHDIIDDRIDVVTRGLLGLTVQCARCHDHKYDPISTSDYYSLYGVFANSIEPPELPLIAAPEETDEYRKFRAELEKRKKAFQDYVAQELAELSSELRSNVGGYLLAGLKESSAGKIGISLGAGETRPRVVARWRSYLKKPSNVFSAWKAYRGIDQTSFQARSEELIADWAKNASVHPTVLQKLEKRRPTKLSDVADLYTELFREIESEWQTQLARDANSKSLPDGDREALRAVLYGEGSPVTVSRDQAVRLFDRATRNKSRELERSVDSYRANSPAAPPRGMVLVDRNKITEPVIFERGNPRRRGARVVRQFFSFLSEEPEPFQKGSGRLELARAIASPRNQLTARVIVNRIWRHHFGLGLVRTSSDFGMRSDPPSHPELLDYLASRLIESGWSLKTLQRLIVLSSTYRQGRSREADDSYAQRDPENTLLWKVNPRRLEFETLHDSILFVADDLDLRMGGTSVKLFAKPFSRRRAVYGFIERQNLPGVFRTFDFANPDATNPHRHETTVPQQGLYMMNNGFIVENAKKLAARSELSQEKNIDAKITWLYATLFARDPNRRDLALARSFLGSADPDDRGQLNAWERYVQVLLISNEFTFID